MPAPVVQDLTQLLTELDPAYAGSRNLYNQQLGALPGELEATNQGIEADKNIAFSGIAKSANSRGLDFFGTPLEEQSRYLGGTYLTSKNNAKAAVASKQMTLQQAIAELERDRYTKAVGRQDAQREQLTSYQSDQEKMAFQAQQAELERQASLQAAAAKGGPATPQWAIKQQNISDLAQALQPKRGGDGYVSPTTYAQAKNEWVKAGYSSKEFDSTFSNLRNPKNRYYKVN